MTRMHLHIEEVQKIHDKILEGMYEWDRFDILLRSGKNWMISTSCGPRSVVHEYSRLCESIDPQDIMFYDRMTNTRYHGEYAVDNFLDDQSYSEEVME